MVIEFSFAPMFLHSRVDNPWDICEHAYVGITICVNIEVVMVCHDHPERVVFLLREVQ